MGGHKELATFFYHDEHETFEMHQSNEIDSTGEYRIYFVFKFITFYDKSQNDEFIASCTLEYGQTLMGMQNC